MTNLGDWASLPFFDTDWPRIRDVLDTNTDAILPPRRQIFSALERTQPANVRVVILGQDPYPTRGHAHGFAFSVEPDVSPLPRSLNNIFKEMRDDLGAAPQNGDLRGWADQGVLLLNTALSVTEGNAGAHARLGWDALAAQVIKETSEKPTAYILWGGHAQAQEKHIQPGDHLIIRTAHPSPLSARRGFFGSKPFSKVNDWLRNRGKDPINWTLRP